MKGVILRFWPRKRKPVNGSTAELSPKVHTSHSKGGSRIFRTLVKILDVIDDVTRDVITDMIYIFRRRIRYRIKLKMLKM